MEVDKYQAAAVSGGIASVVSFFLPWTKYVSFFAEEEIAVEFMSPYEIATTLVGTMFWGIFLLLLILPVISVILGYLKSRWLIIPVVINLILSTVMIFLLSIFMSMISGVDSVSGSLIPPMSYGVIFLYSGSIVSIIAFRKISKEFMEEEMYKAIESKFLKSRLGRSFLDATKTLKRQRGQVTLIAIIIAGIFFTIPVTHTYAVQVRDNFIEEYLSTRPYIEVPSRITFDINRIINATAHDGTVTVYSPPDIYTQDGAPLQVIERMVMVPPPDRTYIYPSTTYVWSVQGEISINITYEVSLYAHIFNFNPWESDLTENIPDTFEYGGRLRYKTDYLGKQWYDEVSGLYIIDSDHPVITDLADNITAGVHTTYLQIKAIYDFMVREFEYEITAGAPKPALVTLSHGFGDCDDQSALLVSLLRAKGIPAWFELGQLYVSNDSSWGGHGWINVYVPRIDGLVDDYDNELGDAVVTIDVVNRLFFVHTPYIFTDYIDDGHGGLLREYYYPYAVSSVEESFITNGSISQGYTKIFISIEDIEQYMPGMQSVTVVMAAVFVISMHIRRRRYLHE